jgi:YesN/AraC family two-component response regulator
MKPKLVIVDDMETVRDELIRGLQGDFEVVAEVGNGVAAIEACLRHLPQLVLLDLILPEFTGIDVAIKIRQELLPLPKIVMLSGVKDQVYVKQALEAGVNEYLFKPVDIRKIAATLWACVSEDFSNAAL